MISPDAVSEALAPDVLAPKIARELGLSGKVVGAALVMLASGDHVPFVARYRRGRIGGLSTGDLERIQRRAAAAAKLEFDRLALHHKLEERGHLGDELARAIDTVRDEIDLDEVRALTRKRRKDGTGKARAAKLDRLVDALWQHGTTAPTADDGGEAPEPGGEAEGGDVGDSGKSDAGDAGEGAGDGDAGSDAGSDAPPTPEGLAAEHTSEEFPTVEDALAGARAICIADLTRRATVRRALRDLAMSSGLLRSSVVEDKRQKAGRYTAFFDHKEACKSIPVARVLGIWRGEREGMLEVRIDVDPQHVLDAAVEGLGIATDRPCGEWLAAAVREAWDGPLGAAVAKGVRRQIKVRADRKAVAQYCDNLRPLLMAPPFGPKPVLAIDPGFQPGCRVVVLDASGAPVADDTVYPLEPKLQAPQTKVRIAELCRAHEVAGIAVGNANGGRDVERLCREVVAEDEGLEVAVVSVEADAAALSAASRAAKEEIKDGDAALRRAVSLGRRLQDPLGELGKLDPRKLGLGQYQHEVDQDELRDALDQVLASCISEVGADVNTAPVELLARISGIGQALAKAMVSRREATGPFRRRTELLALPGFAGKAFEQSAGFLRVVGGEQRLDGTAIHPERYGQVTEMARDLDVTVEELLGNEELLGRIEASKYVGKAGVSGEPLGPSDLELIVAELRNPGADPRPAFAAPTFHPGLKTFEDLEVGMQVDGVVTHLASFGAFVDVGLPDEGLVHVSELAHGFISNPADAVHVGQRVKGLVKEIDPERKRFSLSLKALLPRPEPQEGEARRGKGKKKRKPAAKDKERGKPRKKGERKRQPERVLEFRMDLSALAAQLEDAD